MLEHTEFLHKLSQLDVLHWIAFVPLLLGVYFLPSIIAVFFNRRHRGKIFLANIPAGLSLIAWFALICWAFTGKQHKTAEQTTQ